MRGRPPKAAKVKRVCQQCGKEWEAYEWFDRVLYCSRECFYASRAGRKRELDPSEHDQKKCERCGKAFLVGGAGYARRNAKYCSRTCSKLGYWEAVRSGKIPMPENATFEGASHDQAKEMNNDERIWFAAILDCEGCIRWPRRNVIHSIALTITNTHKGLIDRISEVTGTGRIKTKLAKANMRHSQAWTWDCYGENARSVLRQILPWLIVKREAAETALGLNGATEPPWTQRTRTMRSAEQ